MFIHNDLIKHILQTANQLEPTAEGLLTLCWVPVQFKGRKRVQCHQKDDTGEGRDDGALRMVAEGIKFVTNLVPARVWITILPYFRDERWSTSPRWDEAHHHLSPAKPKLV